MEGDSLAPAKAIDDCNRNAVLPAGVVADIDDDSLQGSEVTSNPVKSGGQPPLTDSFQLKDANVAELPGSAVVKHPRLGLHRLSESIADESLLRRFKELLALPFCEFLMESGLFLWAEVSRLVLPA